MTVLRSNTIQAIAKTATSRQIRPSTNIHSKIGRIPYHQGQLHSTKENWLSDPATYLSASCGLTYVAGIAGYTVSSRNAKSDQSNSSKEEANRLRRLGIDPERAAYFSNI